MNTLKDYVNYKLTHADKLSEAEGYPLELSDCKKHKPMRDLKIYGNSYQGGTPSPETPIEVQSVGELVANETDVNYGKYKIPVVQRGINLFSMAKCNTTPQTINGITFTPLGDERVHVKGKATDTSKSVDCKIVLKEYVYLKAGKYKSKRPSNGMEILFYIYGVGNINSGHNYNTISSGGRFAHAYLYIPPNTVREWDDVIELQLMKGEEDLPYEPYVEPVTTNIYLDEPLRKLGDYADYIDFKENKVVRKCVKKYLKNYNWREKAPSQFDTHACYSIRDDSILPKYGMDRVEISKGYSNYFKLFDSFDIYVTTPNGIHMHSWANNVRVTLSKEYVPNGTNEEFINWLEIYNPYMIRIRAEETEEPLNIDLPKLTAKTTIIEVDTSLAPSNAYGKYIKK